MECNFKCPSALEANNSSNHAKEFEYVWATLQSELNRFWTRFNIFISLQFGLAYGVSGAFFSAIKADKSEDEIHQLSTIIGASIPAILILSVVCYLICHRAIIVYGSLHDTLVSIRHKSGEESCVDQLLEKIHSPMTMHYGRFLSLMLLYAWFILAFYLAVYDPTPLSPTS